MFKSLFIGSALVFSMPLTASLAALNTSSSLEDRTLLKKLQTMLGHQYEVIQKIGEGSESQVFLVKGDDGKKYVVKYFTKIHSPIYMHTDGFQNTVELLSRLDDAPYMMKLVKAFPENLLVLELVEGKDLYHYFRSHPSQSSEKSVLQQYLNAIQDMVLHRNLIPGDPSPPNIIVSDTEVPSIKFVDGGGYLQFDKEINFLEGSPQRQEKFFSPQTVKDSDGVEHKVTITTVFIISISKIIHQISTLLTLLDPQLDYDSFKELPLDDNVSFDGISVRKYHTINVVNDQIRTEIEKLNSMEVNSLASFEEAMELYKIIVAHLIERADVCLNDVSMCKVEPHSDLKS